MSATNPCLRRKKSLQEKECYSCAPRSNLENCLLKKDFDGLGVRVRIYELGIFIVLVAPCTINLVY